MRQKDLKKKLSSPLYPSDDEKRLKLKEILKKENIPYFLDTAQTVGCIGDYDFASTGCDFMSFNGSKWLCGPMGTGIFYCKQSVIIIAIF